MKTVKLGEYIKVLSPKTKIQAKKFLASGKHPIVSQEASYINGYWDNPDDVMILRKPVVIFGDHTRVIKYIDFDFVAGADGTKILVTPDDLDARYFYHWLLAHPVEHLGYARHFRLLKDMVIDIPSLEEQRQIVARLDAAFEKISAAEVLTRQNLDNVSALQKSILHKYLSASDSTHTHRLVDICREIFAGGDVIKSRSSKTMTDEFTVPIFTNGEKMDGLYGYTDTARVTEPSVTVSARGTIGFSAVRKEAFYPAVRLIVLTPDSDKLDVEYLDYAIKSLTIDNTGTSIPQLTVPMIKTYKIPLPVLKRQQEIVKVINDTANKTHKLESEYQKKLAKLAELRQSLLAEAFSTTNTV